MFNPNDPNDQNDPKDPKDPIDPNDPNDPKYRRTESFTDDWPYGILRKGLLALSHFQKLLKVTKPLIDTFNKKKGLVCAFSKYSVLGWNWAIARSQPSYVYIAVHRCRNWRPLASSSRSRGRTRPRIRHKTWAASPPPAPGSWDHHLIHDGHILTWLLLFVIGNGFIDCKLWSCHSVSFLLIHSSEIIQVG